MRYRGRTGLWLVAVLCAGTTLCLSAATVSAATMTAMTVGAQRPPGDPPSVYVTNQTISTVSVVDPVTDVITGTIPVGPGPTGIAATPDGAKVYVTNSFSNTVSVIDTAAGAVTKTITVGTSPNGVTVSPNGGLAYVVNQYSNDVSVINTATDTVTATIGVGFAPQAVAFSPDGATAYVANENSGTVSVINTATNAVTATISLGGTPLGIAVTPDGSTVYVTNAVGTVQVISAATNALTTTIPVGSTPIGVVVAPDGSVYVTNSGSASVSVISTATNTVSKTIAVGGTPTDVAVTPDGATAYVTNFGSPTTVSKITTDNNTVTATIDGFFNPYGVTFAPMEKAPPANLRITKHAPPEAPQGLVIEYTLDIVNDGPATADDVVVTDQIPADVTLVSHPPQCAPSAGTLTCHLGSLAQGETTPLTYTVRVSPSARVDDNIEDCAAVSSTTPQDTEDGKDSCASTTVVPDPADLSVTKSGPATALPGGTVMYDFTVINHGPDMADSVDFSDVFPADLTGISVPGDCRLVVQTLTCSLGTLANSARRTFTVTATVAPGTADGRAIENCATVTSSMPDPDLENNGSCSDTVVGTGPPPAATDIGMTKVGPVTMLQGGTASYQLIVYNRGGVAADGTEIEDVLPDNVTVTGVPGGCTLADRTLTCTVGTLAAGTSAEFTVPVRVSADAPAGFDVADCATARTSTPDSDLVNNEECTQAQVEHEPVTEVTTDKAGPGAAARGEAITYKLTVTNRSGVDAHGTVLGDVLPEEVEVTGTPDGCTLSGLSLTCAIGILPGGASRTFLVTAKVNADLAPHSAFQNCASVYTTTTETDLPDNPACVQTLVSAAPPLVPVTG